MAGDKLPLEKIDLQGPQDRQFDDWNALKKDLHYSSRECFLYPQEREVWICSLGMNIGSEQNGTDHIFARPVLVIKKFNNQLYWIVPLSSKQKEHSFYFNCNDVNGIPISVIIAQLRLVHIKRFKRRMYQFPLNLFIQIKKRLISFLSTELV